MSRENVEVALQVMDALSRRDASALVSLADPDVQWHSLFAMGDHFSGYDGTRRYMSDLDDAWEVGRADVEDSLAVGDLVVMVGRIHYRGRAGGTESETPVLWLLKFREGRVLRFRAFRDPEQALEAVGLRE